MESSGSKLALVNQAHLQRQCNPSYLEAMLNMADYTDGSPPPHLLTSHFNIKISVLHFQGICINQARLLLN